MHAFVTSSGDGGSHCLQFVFSAKHSGDYVLHLTHGAGAVASVRGFPVTIRIGAGEVTMIDFSFLL